MMASVTSCNGRGRSNSPTHPVELYPPYFSVVVAVSPASLSSAHAPLIRTYLLDMAGLTIVDDVHPSADAGRIRLARTAADGGPSNTVALGDILEIETDVDVWCTLERRELVDLAEFKVGGAGFGRVGAKIIGDGLQLA